MDARISALIDSYQHDLIAMLERWISVPSVKDTPAEGAPFGQKVRDMLDMAMADAEAMGFSTRNFDGYACDATLGSEEHEKIAVLAHLDVVPAGDGWNTDPFTAVTVGDQMFGRGTSDDKGPAVAALFAMKAIKEAGIPLKRSVRLILGCDEESGWEDMAYYQQHTEIPAVGFTPDASFPCINTEKAMLHCGLRAPAPTEGLIVKEMLTGERLNVIPGESKVLLQGGEELAARVAAYAAETGLPYEAEVTADGVWVTATGIPGHSAYPEGRRSAIYMMLKLFSALGAAATLKTLCDGLASGHDAASLGCACCDEMSGPLTCNMGICHITNGEIYATLDMRVPVTADLEQLEANARAALPGFSFVNVEKKPAHYVPADSELVSNLLAAWTEETGLPGAAESTGGGTYAKVLKEGVAFGMSFPGDEDVAHQANEYIYVSKLLKSVKIFANALLRLCAE